MKSISELPEHWQRWYQEWDAIVPENDNKLHLQGDLLSEPGSQQSYSAAFELFLFSSFNNMGLNVDFQPEINGVNPDFCISDMRGYSAFVEAGAMFSDPIQKDLSYSSSRASIWEEFKKLQSQEFSVTYASSSGHPGNFSPRSVLREVQQWIDQLDTAEVCMEHYSNIPPFKRFQFSNWSLDVELNPKSPEDRERLGATAIELAGFSSVWSDVPAKRLKSKLEEKSSQVRRTKSHCIVAITERQGIFSVDDVQTALLGGTSYYGFHFRKEIADSHPYLKGLSIPKPKTDGLWSPHDVEEPIAVIVHRGNLQYPNDGETELWLNPNSSYDLVPLPLFTLKIYSAKQKIWTRPATGL